MGLYWQPYLLKMTCILFTNTKFYNILWILCILFTNTIIISTFFIIYKVKYLVKWHNYYYIFSFWCAIFTATPTQLLYKWCALYKYFGYHFPDTHHPCDSVLIILSVMWSNIWSNQYSHLALESQFRDYESFYVNYIRQTNFITQLLIIFHKSSHKTNWHFHNKQSAFRIMCNVEYISLFLANWQQSQHFAFKIM